MIGRRLHGFGGSGSGFTVPNPAPYDDEFDNGQGSWTAWTNIPGSTVDFGVTTASRVHMQHATAITRPGLPSFPFTVEAYCASILYDNIATQTANATLGLGFTPVDDTHGGFYGLEWDIDTLGRIGIFDGRFVPMLGATPTHIGSIQDNQLGTINQVPHKQKIVAHSATNFDLYYTKDVVSVSPTFTLYQGNLNPTMTINCLYLVSFGCTTEWEYVRFT